jgi:hypothetical protein
MYMRRHTVWCIRPVQFAAHFPLFTAGFRARAKIFARLKPFLPKKRKKRRPGDIAGNAGPNRVKSIVYMCFIVHYDYI